METSYQEELKLYVNRIQLLESKPDTVANDVDSAKEQLRERIVEIGREISQEISRLSRRVSVEVGSFQKEIARRRALSDIQQKQIEFTEYLQEIPFISKTDMIILMDQFEETNHLSYDVHESMTREIQMYRTLVNERKDLEDSSKLYQKQIESYDNNQIPFEQQYQEFLSGKEELLNMAQLDGALEQEDALRQRRIGLQRMIDLEIKNQKLLKSATQIPEGFDAVNSKILDMVKEFDSLDQTLTAIKISKIYDKQTTDYEQLKEQVTEINTILSERSKTMNRIQENFSIYDAVTFKEIKEKNKSYQKELVKIEQQIGIRNNTEFVKNLLAENNEKSLEIEKQLKQLGKPSEIINRHSKQQPKKEKTAEEMIRETLDLMKQVPSADMTQKAMNTSHSIEPQSPLPSRKEKSLTKKRFSVKTVSKSAFAKITMSMVKRKKLWRAVAAVMVVGGIFLLKDGMAFENIHTIGDLVLGDGVDGLGQELNGLPDTDQIAQSLDNGTGGESLEDTVRQVLAGNDMLEGQNSLSGTQIGSEVTIQDGASYYTDAASASFGNNPSIVSADGTYQGNYFIDRVALIEKDDFGNPTGRIFDVNTNAGVNATELAESLGLSSEQYTVSYHLNSGMDGEFLQASRSSGSPGDLGWVSADGAGIQVVNGPEQLKEEMGRTL